MTSRNLSFKDEEAPNKRQRILDTTDILPASFDALNNDCVLYIASFLPTDDSNTFGTINRRCRGIRRHESLDQTRIATIICSRARGRGSYYGYPRSLRSALGTARRVLSANYTHLKIVGLDVLGDGRFERDRIPGATLRHVTKLELSPTPNERSNNNHITRTQLSILEPSLPNVSEMVINSVKIGENDIDTRNFFFGFAHLEKVHHVGDLIGIHLTGYEYSAPTLTCLVLDDCCLHSLVHDPGSIDCKRLVLRQFADNGPGNQFLLMECRQLQRLSIKGAAWCLLDWQASHRADAQPIPQEMLIKMVRRHPTLRWLRSDLSEENVTMLQRERPEITFVSE